MGARSRLLLAVLTLVGWTTSRAGAEVMEVDLGRGPIVVHYPEGNDSEHPAPLLILLHGYTASGPAQSSYFGLLPHVEAAGFIYAYPDGTSNPEGNPFWNATDACCDFYGSGVDDSGYLLALVEEIRGRLAVDPWRVHFSGHSNGGFMSYRMACDHSDVLASIGGLAGATWDDPADCDPVGPMHVLQVHGTADDTILFDGGSILGAPYPGAVESAERWAGMGGCDLVPDTTGPNLDLDGSIAGVESTVAKYETGCDPAASAELWTIHGGAHSPFPLADGFSSGLVDFARSHRKASVVFSGKQTLEWAPMRWAAEYRVYRGEIADLVDEDGDGLPDGGYGDCISSADPDASDTSLLLNDQPPPGGGWYYVVGFREPDAGESILGTTSMAVSRRPALACP
jgi:polyhydroxybutyrate depolymerase